MKFAGVVLAALAMAFVACGQEEKYAAINVGIDGGTPTDGGTSTDGGVVVTDGGQTNCVAVGCGSGCGGLCEDFKNCTMDADCMSGVCGSGLCQVPRCQDNVKNGEEIDVDCGPPACLRRCTTGQMCTRNEDCDLGLCYAGRCRQQNATSSLSITSNVPVNPVTHFYTLTREATMATPGSVTFTKEEVCGTQYTVNGVVKRGLKVNAEVGNEWWDCGTSPYHKLDNLIFAFDNLAIPKNKLETFNNGQTCSGNGPGDVFIPADIIGFYCQ